MNTEELLDTKNIQYRYSGADLLVRCINPEHEDVHPSMRIDKLTGKFNCLSCGFGGNIFRHFNVTQNQADIAVLALKEKIRKLMTPKLSIPLGAEVFNKDYRGISASTFSKFEAFTFSDIPDLSGRIVFPLYDVSGNITCFHGRRLHSELKPKYKNYPARVEKTFFPAVPEQLNGSVILVEGVFDVLNLYDKGLTNVVSSLGLIQCKKRDKRGDSVLEKFSLLGLQGISTIYIMYDGDIPGLDAAKKLEKILCKKYTAEVIELPENLDPGAMTKEQVTKLKRLIYESSGN